MPYAFTQEDYIKFQEDVLGANGDQATISTVLADMQGTITESLAMVESTKSANEELTAENTRLKESNITLLRKVGENALSIQAPRQQIYEDDEPKYRDADEYMQAYFNKGGK